MASAAAALLDELMGRNRNLPSDATKSELHWSDSDVCKHFLCGFCPHELFVNTRADLGSCSKIHDDALKKEYEKSSRFSKMGYEDDFIRFLQSLITDVERRIRRGHQRLTFNMAQANVGAGGGKEEKVEMLTQRINDLCQQAESLGCEGKVEEAQGVMKLCEQLKEERSVLESAHAPAEIPGMKQMEVCEICGALLIVGDAEQRVQEHLMGKQHMGYAQVRATVDDFMSKKKNNEQEREDRLRREREEREKEREKEREERRKEREKEEKRRKRSRSRSRRSRSREKRKSRERKRSRSRDRKHSRRSGSREKSRRSRSRDRSRRSRSRDKRSRHRSRSRDRHRDRSKDKKAKEERKSDRGHTSGDDEAKPKLSENGDSKEQTPVSSSDSKTADTADECGAGDATRDLSEGDS